VGADVSRVFSSRFVWATQLVCTVLILFFPKESGIAMCLDEDESPCEMPMMLCTVTDRDTMHHMVMTCWARYTSTPADPACAVLRYKKQMRERLGVEVEQRFPQQLLGSSGGEAVMRAQYVTMLKVKLDKWCTNLLLMETTPWFDTAGEQKEPDTSRLGLMLSHAPKNLFQMLHSQVDVAFTGGHGVKVQTPLCRSTPHPAPICNRRDRWHRASVIYVLWRRVATSQCLQDTSRCLFFVFLLAGGGRRRALKKKRKK
jgi:hypothetical protein